MKHLLRRLLTLLSKSPTESVSVVDQKVNHAKPTQEKTETRKSNYVAFDLEIAKIIPEDFSLWRSYRPLGISCAALQFDGHEPELWYSKTDNGDFADKMSQVDSNKLVDYLVLAIEKGWNIVTWNGLGFDFDVLVEESGRWDDCKRLSISHIDMMFHFFCLQGYPLSLEKAAKGMGLSGKIKGMTGDLAPILWQQGKQSQVLEYVAQDVRTTLEVSKVGSIRKCISWTSNRGNFQQVHLPHGWYTVAKANQLPFPNNTWMSNPLSRNDFINWTKRSYGSIHDSNKIKSPEIQITSLCEKHEKTPTQFTLQRTPTEEEINDILSLYDPQPDFEPSIIKDEMDYPSEQLGCPCPICMGCPNLDPIFLYAEYLEWLEHEEDSYWDFEEYQ